MRMKRLLAWMILLLCLLSACACAQEEIALPQGVADLCARVHPGYAIAAYDGWGDETCGQFALILSRDGDNILCMAEKAQDEPTYSLTIDNTNAVYDGDVLPSVMIDTGGDSLWYTYLNTEEDSSAHYGSIKDNGQWGCVSVLSYWPKEDGFTGMWASVSALDGTLRYEEIDEDENENIRDRWMYAPIEISREYAQSLELAQFDINTFDADPRDGLYPMTANDAFNRSQAEESETLLDMDVSRVHTARLLQTAQGRSSLRVEDWDGTFLHHAASLVFDQKAVLDTYHAGDGRVYVSCGTMTYTLRRVDEGRWMLSGVDERSGVHTIGPDYVSPDGQSIVHRNDGFVYGASPWSSLKTDAAVLASSYEEMAAQLDTSAYALVSNPNPEDRLHLREKPDKGSHSYGKFYNRTPVWVLERGDTWTKVQIGRGGAAMTGYMMTKFLAFDEAEKAALACAFPQKVLKDVYRLEGIRLYAEPRNTAVTERIYRLESDDFIIGVCGDDWYIVLRADGAVGYAPQNAFWDGNG